MLDDPVGGADWKNSLKGKVMAADLMNSRGAAFALAILIGVAGCRTPPPIPESVEQEARKPDAMVLVLHEGDIVRISFPGAPNLNTTQQIRRDGKIALQLIGEFKASGMTPADMEKELIKLYGPQLLTKEVSVTVESSAFPVYLTGAVLRPGKIMSDRPLTALEAIMEAGGFDYAKASVKSVRVIRNENGRVEYYTLNLKGVLQGEQHEQFSLKPYDIIYVPERFTWF